MADAVLRTENLTKRYGPLVAVDDLTLEVRPGEVLGLLGPNGAGKTTSILMMCGLLRPDAGRVLVHGRPIANGAGEVRARVGVCPQEVALWGKLTCLEQLEFVGQMYGLPRRLARQRGLALLETLGLADRCRKLARTLSGGMQRRLNLAMALVHDPDIVVLDEPEAGLDPQGRVLVRDYVRSLARQKTIILTTHNIDEADRLADRVAIIDRGRLLRLDSPEALKRQVGEGDVLEIEAANEADFSVEAATAAVSPLVAEVTAAGRMLVLRAPGIVERLPTVLETLRAAGFRPGEARLRENTLEDVFIALTGRRLRE